MANFKLSVDDGTLNDGNAYPLAADENADGIVTPKNVGPDVVWVLHVPQGDAPTPAEVVAAGFPVEIGEQLQLGSGQSTRNLTKYFAACAAGKTGTIHGIY